MSEITFVKADASNVADVAQYFALEQKMSGSKMYAVSKDEAEAKEDLEKTEVYLV